MARIVSAPPPAIRRTRHPYNEWTRGAWVELRYGEDFFVEAHKVAQSYNAWCKRRGIAGKATARRDENVSGSPYHLIYVWGDATRKRSLGLPKNVLEHL